MHMVRESRRVGTRTSLEFFSILEIARAEARGSLMLFSIFLFGQIRRGGIGELAE